MVYTWRIAFRNRIPETGTNARNQPRDRTEEDVAGFGVGVAFLIIWALCRALSRDQDDTAEVVAGNKGLIAELAHLSADRPPEHPPEERGRHPVYVFWHSHIRSLIAAQRPDLDADMIAHVMLGVVDSEPILTLITTEGPGRLSRTMGALITAMLDAPPAAAPAR
jgi:hypothetical protein